MDRLVRIVLRYPVALIVVTVVVAVAAQVVHLRQARYDFGFESVAPKHTIAYERYVEFEDNFGHGRDGTPYVIGFRDDPLITNENLDLIRRITERIEAMDATLNVTSLINVQDIVGTGDMLEVTDFVPSGPLTDTELADLTSRLMADPIIAGNLISDDGKMTTIVGRLLEYSDEPDERVVYMGEVKRILEEEGGGRFEFYLAGIPYLDSVMMTHVNHDTSLFIPATVCVLGMLMYAAFRQVRAVWMTLLPLTLASLLTLGLLSLLDMPMTVLTGQGVLASLIMVIGLSDAVHLLNRYREEVQDDPGTGLFDRYRALGRTMRHMGKACFLTSATTAIGFLSLATTDIRTIREFGFLGAAGIVFAYVGSIVLLPAAMVLTERLRVSKVPKRRGSDGYERFLQATVGVAIHHPTAITAVGVAVLLGSMALATRVEIDNRFTRDLKSDDPAVISTRFFERHMGGSHPLEIIVKGSEPDAVKDPAVLAAMDHVRDALEALPTISKVATPVDFIKKMNQALHDNADGAYALPETAQAVAQYLLLFEMGGGDNEFDRLVTYDYSMTRMQAMLHDIPPAEYWKIIATLEEAVRGRFPPGIDVYESGTEPLFYTVSERLVATLVRSLYFAMPIVFLMTSLAFRSIKLAMIGILPNLLPLTIGLGVMGALGISLRLSTVIAFPMAFGLAIDDTLHFLNRYRTELRAGRDNLTAVRNTARTTGRAVVLTTVFLVGGYAVMFTSGFLGIVHMGVVVTVILVAALFGDLLVLPAMLVLAGPRVVPQAQEAQEA
jgi:hypothetical protein